MRSLPSLHPFFSLLLSSLELIDTTIYEPYTRALHVPHNSHESEMWPLSRSLSLALSQHVGYRRMADEAGLHVP